MSLLPSIVRPVRTRRQRASTSTPRVIAHRGASGYRPEHTLASYQLAMEQGADYVEPDLVPTKDGVLVARHESEISATTDVALHQSLANRRTIRVVDGVPVCGWFVEDFTLDELKSLRATERMPRLRPRSSRYDGLFDIPTLDEVLHLVERQSRVRGEVIGVAPEIKRPSYFASIGLAPEGMLTAALERHHLNRPNARIKVQSFDAASLSRLRARLKVPLVQLIAPRDRHLASPDVLAQVATYADAIGAEKTLVLPRTRDGWTATATGLVDSAHAVGLEVYVYTLRDENRFLPRDYRRGVVPRRIGNPSAEYAAYFSAGVDAVFTDHPDTAVAARAAWLAQSEGIRTQATT